jgi:molybdenum cofactor guanylyltransferase
MNNEIIFGLVLAGGESKRMGKDKASLIYYNKPQYKIAFDILLPFCEKVFISVNHAQDIELPFIMDKLNTSANGPALGIASAFEFKMATWLVLAVDYPLISEKEISFLIQNRDKQASASVYINDRGFFEPGIGLYEPGFNVFLQEEIKYGNSSLQNALINSNSSKVMPEDGSKLFNVNTPGDFEFIKSVIK